MVGRPQRDQPKENLRLIISERVYASMRPLYRNGVVSFGSRSRLVETIVFLSEHIYAVEPDNGFVLDLARLHADQVIEQIKNPELFDSCCLHVSLDRQAVAFIDMLVAKYPMLFSSRSEVVELLLWNIGRECNTEKGVRYYVNRLEEVMAMHPTRVDRRKKA